VSLWLSKHRWQGQRAIGADLGANWLAHELSAFEVGKSSLLLRQQAQEQMAAWSIRRPVQQFAMAVDVTATNKLIDAPPSKRAVPESGLPLKHIGDST
jgi:hypothetical protein